MSRIDPIHTFGEQDLSGFDVQGLQQALAKLSDKDLDKLADELDFCSFRVCLRPVSLLFWMILANWMPRGSRFTGVWFRKLPKGWLL